MEVERWTPPPRDFGKVSKPIYFSIENPTFAIQNFKNFGAFGAKWHNWISLWYQSQIFKNFRRLRRQFKQILLYFRWLHQSPGAFGANKLCLLGCFFFCIIFFCASQICTLMTYPTASKTCVNIWEMAFFPRIGLGFGQKFPGNSLGFPPATPLRPSHPNTLLEILEDCVL